VDIESQDRPPRRWMVGRVSPLLSGSSLSFAFALPHTRSLPFRCITSSDRIFRTHTFDLPACRYFQPQLLHVREVGAHRPTRLYPGTSQTPYVIAAYFQTQICDSLVSSFVSKWTRWWRLAITSNHIDSAKSGISVAVPYSSPISKRPSRTGRCSFCSTLGRLAVGPPMP